jgi:UDP-glucose:(heptosyl)LPS alpha-1,3-glucosyltransferase
MKVAVVRRRFSSTGGAELYVQRLIGALTAAGHEVHLISEKWSEAPDKVLVHKMSGNQSRSHRAQAFARAAAEEVSRFKFDCVFSLERTLKQDVYRAGDGIHKVWVEKRRHFSPWWKRPFVALGGFHRGIQELEAQTFHPANTAHIIVNSLMVRHEIIDKFNFPADRIHLVRNGVETSRFIGGNREQIRMKFGIKEGEFLALFVGSGWERKGLHFLLEALKGTPEIKLLVAGRGRKPVSAPRNAIFAGPMPDVENAYAAADLLVTLPIYEPSANVVCEGLAAGLPVVTSVNNGAAEILEEGVTGSILEEFWKPEIVGAALRYWSKKRTRIQSDHRQLSIERNVSETLVVLELAAAERKR